jgi:CheY-like chemotaxis protein
VVECQGPTASPATKPEVLVVDDNIFVLEAWVDTLREDAVVHTMASLEDLGARLEADPGFAARLLLAVTDMHLDGSAGDGLDVGRLLKKYRPELRVLLSSDGIFSAAELVGAIDVAIGKDPVGLAALNSL